MHNMIPKQELRNIEGGGWIQIVGIVGGVLTFLFGMVDGIMRPLSCHK